MNGEYIKKMENDKYYELILPHIREVVQKDYDLKKIADLVKTRMETLLDAKDMIDFFDELPDYDVAMYTHKKMKTDTEIALNVLIEQLPLLEALEEFKIETIEKTIMGYIAEKGIKNGTGLWPLRTAVSGKQSTPGGAYEIAEILGKEESLRRIRIGIEKLRQG